MQLEKKLRDLKGAFSEEELMARLKDCAIEIANVTQLAKSREKVICMRPIVFLLYVY